MAQPHIADAEVNVLPTGGFSGRAPTPTVVKRAGLTSADQLGFMLRRSVAPGGQSSGAFHNGSARRPGAVEEAPRGDRPGMGWTTTASSYPGPPTKGHTYT